MMNQSSEYGAVPDRVVAVYARGYSRVAEASQRGPRLSVAMNVGESPATVAVLSVQMSGVCIGGCRALTVSHDDIRPKFH